MRVFLPIAAAFALLSTFVNAECPNGCSGNGECQEKDMCKCYKNYQGNDCADRTCPFSYAHVDTPKGDINMDRNRASTNPVLVNSQQFPSGTYEYFPTGAATGEAHFYMECANKGICDRSTGICNCFDGYEGAGCQRTVCPNKCSGHGTCESLEELANKAGGTLFGTTTPVGAVKYNLWDAKTSYGCRCDPWFFGPDCSKRTCKVGVDPLYKSNGIPIYETVVFRGAQAGFTAGDFQLRLFDYYGESYITKKINLLVDTGNAGANAGTNAAKIQTAINELPNLTFQNVKCEAAGTSGSFKVESDTGTVVGFAVVCRFNNNPGVLRIPEFALKPSTGTYAVTNTLYRGQNEDWHTTKTALVLSGATAPTDTVITTTTSAQDVYGAGRSLIKIDQYTLLVESIATTAITLAYDINSANVPLTTSMSFFKSGHTVTQLAAKTDLTANGGDVDVGATEIKFAAAHGLVAGDTIVFHHQIFNVRGAGSTANSIKLDRPFGGTIKDGLKAVGDAFVYKLVEPTDKTTKYTYVSECSGRGLCEYDTGICKCFKGYTDDNCSRQNILAV